MKKTLAMLFLAAVCSVGTAVARDKDSYPYHHGNIQRVLLISIDGMHAVDLLNCANGIPGLNNGQPYCPTLAALAQTGVNYVAASTSKPSDSFPGLAAIITGGSPAFTGVYYDVAYSRNYDGPAIAAGTGLGSGYNPPGPCPAKVTGFTTEYDEGIDINYTLLNGGAPGASLTDGGFNSLDPQKIVRDPANGCQPVWPWQFYRANTIFSVIHQNGGITAWSDKHPSYAAVTAGVGPSALNDFYTPEIASTVVNLPPGVTTPSGVSCQTVPDPNGGAWTDSFQNIQCYDTLKVNAVLNWIDGKKHLGNGYLPDVPNIFGMNFQAVSVGEKLIEGGVRGGYLDAAATPGAALFGEFQFVDASIAEFVSELKKQGLFDSTLIVITAKHGQSPIDPSLYISQLINYTSPATLLSTSTTSTGQAFIPSSESTTNADGIGPTEDDVSLLWLTNSSYTDAAVAILEGDPSATGIALGEIYYGPTVSLNYNEPTQDPRTPDIIVTPNVGVTYSGSTSKLAEHGGFSHDDTNVILLMSNPSFAPATVKAAVGTAQVAPTILQALHINPQSLDAVRAEGTPVLPGLELQ